MDPSTELLIPIREAALIGRCSIDFLKAHGDTFGLRKQGGRLLVDFQKLEINLPPEIDRASLPRFRSTPPDLEHLEKYMSAAETSRLLHHKTTCPPLHFLKLPGTTFYQGRWYILKAEAHTAQSKREQANPLELTGLMKLLGITRTVLKQYIRGSRLRGVKSLSQRRYTLDPISVLEVASTTYPSRFDAVLKAIREHSQAPLDEPAVKFLQEKSKLHLGILEGITHYTSKEVAQLLEFKNSGTANHPQVASELGAVKVGSYLYFPKENVHRQRIKRLFSNEDSSLLEASQHSGDVLGCLSSIDVSLFLSKRIDSLALVLLRFLDDTSLSNQAAAAQVRWISKAAALGLTQHELSAYQNGLEAKLKETLSSGDPSHREKRSQLLLQKVFLQSLNMLMTIK